MKSLKHRIENEIYKIVTTMGADTIWKLTNLQDRVTVRSFLNDVKSITVFENVPR